MRFTSASGLKHRISAGPRRAARSARACRSSAGRRTSADAAAACMPSFSSSPTIAFEPVAIARDERHGVALGSEPPCDGGADPGARADDGDWALHRTISWTLGMRESWRIRNPLPVLPGTRLGP